MGVLGVKGIVSTKNGANRSPRPIDSEESGMFNLHKEILGSSQAAGMTEMAGKGCTKARAFSEQLCLSLSQTTDVEDRGFDLFIESRITASKLVQPSFFGETDRLIRITELLVNSSRRTNPVFYLSSSSRVPK